MEPRDAVTSPGPAAGILYIIRRDLPELETHVRESFAEVPQFISVIVDRRVGERRCAPDSPPLDRRVGERRQRRIDETLRTLGWAIIRR